MRVAVIGAGPAGITAANRLALRGADVEVFEALDRVGGLSRTLSLWGQRVDLGPHRFFTRNERVKRLWLDAAGDDARQVDRTTRIFHSGRFFAYPLRPVNVLRQLGILESGLSMASYAGERLRRASSLPDRDTFESWITRRFGRRLYRTFFKNYSEKLWGIPCSELSADFAAQRIKNFSLLTAVWNALGFRSTAPTLVDRFSYPTGGAGMVYERLASAARDAGARVHLQTGVQRVVVEDGRVAGLELSNGKREAFERVVSTMKLDDVLSGLPDVPADVADAAKRLSYRNTLVVFVEVDAVDLFDDQWIYVHSPDLAVGRITNFRNWVPELYGEARTTILALEYWCSDGDPRWEQDTPSLTATAERELRATGLIGGAAILRGCDVKLRGSYPVYRVGYRGYVETIARYVDGIEGLTAIGRNGSYRYNNQDHSILMGLLAAENVLDRAGHDLWRVNTDYASYQEAGS